MRVGRRAVLSDPEPNPCSDWGNRMVAVPVPRCPYGSAGRAAVQARGRCGVGAGATAVLLTGYAVDPVFVRGGAQRVAAELCDRLTELGWTVRVIECAAWRESIDPGHSFVAGMAGHSALARQWRGAGPATAIDAEDVGDAVSGAHLVLVVDRAVGRLDIEAHRVLLLSNLVYDNERQAAVHGDHDSGWVVSPYLVRQLAVGAC